MNLFFSVETVYLWLYKLYLIMEREKRRFFSTFADSSIQLSHLQKEEYLVIRFSFIFQNLYEKMKMQT